MRSRPHREGRVCSRLGPGMGGSSEYEGRKERCGQTMDGEGRRARDGIRKVRRGRITQGLVRPWSRVSIVF